jgi:hypothetical protein
MNAFHDTINLDIELGTAAEKYFKRKVHTKSGETNTLSGYYAVKGGIKKPGGFIRTGALVIDVHELRKDR